MIVYCLLSKIVDNFKIFNVEYNLFGIISCPTTAHYSSSIINYPYDNQDLKKNESYYNDDLIIPSIIKNINNLKMKTESTIEFLSSKNIYILINKK